jgi:hypothetical protein
MSKLMSGGLGYNSGAVEDGEELDQKITTATKRRGANSRRSANRIDKALSSAPSPGAPGRSRSWFRPGAGTDHVFRRQPPVRLQLHAQRPGLPAPGRHGLEIRARHPKRSIERHLVFPLSTCSPPARSTWVTGHHRLRHRDFQAHLVKEDRGALVGAAIEVRLTPKDRLSQSPARA